MITVRRNTERRHVRHKKQDTWHTFFRREGSDPPADDFGVLLGLDEVLLTPGGVAASRPGGDTETITYVYKGALAQEDSTGNSGVIHAGEFQRMTIGRGVCHKEKNASRADPVRIFRISLRPSEAGLGCAREQKRFAAAERHNVACVVGSPDGRKGSLRILQDALVYSSILDPGHHLIHELLPGRSGWLHVIGGEATLQDIVLTAGDGAGVATEPAVSLTAEENTEILLVDLGPAPRSFAGGAVP